MVRLNDPITGSEYVLKFVHIEKEARKKGAAPQFRATLAYLFNRDGKLVASGAAHVHPADNFDRRIGRRIAFQRLLEYLKIGGFGRPFLKAVHGAVLDSGAKL
jgi:hypothetical protein